MCESYMTAMRYLDSLAGRGSKPGLENITALLRRLGNPEQSVPVVHVAGTNGKGSTIAFAGSILQEAGLTVGAYTSPAVYHYLERYTIDGAPVSDEMFAATCQRVRQAAECLEKEEQLYPTVFEVETAIAFCLFLERVDVLLLEAGMGGRLDSTNVVDKPLCTVLTSISKDHMQFLGDTILEIAAEKLGILRNAVPLVVHPANREQAALWELITDCAKEKGAPVISAIDAENPLADDTDSVYRITGLKPEGTTVLFDGTEYHIGMCGTYQASNAVTGLLAARETLQALGRPCEKKALQNGLQKAVWHGRFERIGSNPEFYVDGAHNIDACRRLRESVETYFAGKRCVFLIGVYKDKEYREMMKLMAPLAAAIVTVPTSGTRGLSAETLAKACKPYCSEVWAAASIEEGVEQGRALANREQGVLLAFGSLSYLGNIHG